VVGRRNPHPGTIAAIRAAIQEEGLEFIKDRGGGSRAEA
jgi:hypothetical protein